MKQKAEIQKIPVIENLPDLEMVIETVEIKNQTTGESLQTEKEFLLKMNLKKDSRLLSISS